MCGLGVGGAVGVEEGLRGGVGDDGGMCMSYLFGCVGVVFFEAVDVMRFVPESGWVGDVYKR